MHGAGLRKRLKTVDVDLPVAGSLRRSAQSNGESLLGGSDDYSESDDDVVSGPSNGQGAGTSTESERNKEILSFWKPVEGDITSSEEQSNLTARRVGRLGLRMHQRKPAPAAASADGRRSPSRENGGERESSLPDAIHGSIAFGDHAHEEDPEKNHFACVSYRLHEDERLLSLLYKGWGLRRPSVMLSILGADESDGILALSRALEDAYIDGITSIAGKTDAWILTNGFSCGASDLTGKAVASFGARGASDSSRPQCACIAVTPLPDVKYADKFLPPAVPLSTSAILKLCPRNLHQWKIFGTQRGFNLRPPRAKRHAQPQPSTPIYATCEQTFEIVKARLEEHAYDDDDALSHMQRLVLLMEQRSKAEAAMLGEVTSPKELLDQLAGHSSYSRRRAGRPASPARTVEHVELALLRLMECVFVASRISSANHRLVSYTNRDVNCPRAAPKDNDLYDTTGYALEPHHTHFVLVDAPAATAAPTNSKSSDSKSSNSKSTRRMGRSAGLKLDVPLNIMKPHEQLRQRLETAVQERDTSSEIPLISVVLGGGDATYAKLLEVLDVDNPLILIKESGGVAAQLARLIELATIALDSGSPLADDHAEVVALMGAEPHSLPRKLASLILAKLKLERMNDGLALSSSVSAAERPPPLLHVYADHHTPLDQVIFDAIVGSYRRQTARQRERDAKRQGRKKKYRPMGPTLMPQHYIARGRHPAYEERLEVSDAMASWTAPFDDYLPTNFTSPIVLQNAKDLPTGGKWADLADVAEISDLYNRMTFEYRTLKTDKEGYVSDPELLRTLQEQGFKVVPSGVSAGTTEEAAHWVGALAFKQDPQTGKYYPMNPRGRTGMVGRGLLGCWGPNHAADPIVTRWNPNYPEGEMLEVIAVQRKDTGDWALPGGIVTPGEQVSATVLREFKHEAANLSEPHEQELMETYLHALFANGEVVYRGYVDDPRNTDNAWMETQAIHFHCPRLLAERLTLSAGDDSNKVTWLHCNADEEPRYALLYGNHREMVDTVSERLRKHVQARTARATYPPRFRVPDEQVSWSVAYPEYENAKRTGQMYDYTDKEVHRQSRDNPPQEGEPPGAPRFADPHHILHAMHKYALTDARCRGKTFLDELREDRHTYEGEIQFEGETGRPLNPRGRTGLAGRGSHFKWGVNEATDTIVTRYHPRDNRLQFVAIKRIDGGQWAIPGAMLRAGEKSKTKARKLFEEKVLGQSEERADEKARARLSTMLDELFARVDQNVVYTGYVDDPRNTDNAWVETTAYHFHCTRELGGMLPLSGGIDEKYDKAHLKSHWLDADEDSAEYNSLFGNHKLLVDRVVKRIRDSTQPGLLYNVITWGKRDWAEQVFDDPLLVELRSPTAVQQAFQIALKRAGNPQRFDVSIIELLLQYGASPADIFVSELFTPGGGIEDSFRLMHDVTHGRFSPRSAHLPLTFKDVGGGVKQLTGDLHQAGRRARQSVSGLSSGISTKSGKGSRSPSPSGKGSEMHEIGAAAVSCLSSSRESARSSRRSSRRESGGTKAVAVPPMTKVSSSNIVRSGSGYPMREREATALSPLDVSTVKKVEEDELQQCKSTPFRNEEIAVIEKFAPGFAVYAPLQHAATTFDLMLWAILAGAPSLAMSLWTMCEIPIRASLVGQSMCEQLIARYKIHVTELNKLRDGLSDGATGILDNLESPEVARRLLLSSQSVFAVVGSRSGRKISKLQLALDLGNLKFVEHRYPQGILDDKWMGRTPECGSVRLTKLEGLWTLALQSLLLNFVMVRLVPVAVNDLKEHGRREEIAERAHGRPRRSHVHVPRLQAILAFYTIPLVKRANMIVFTLGYMAIAVIIYFSDPCDQTDSFVHLFAAWTLACIVDELTNWYRDRELFWREFWNLFDIFACTCNAIAIVLRYLLDPRFGPPSQGSSSKRPVETRVATDLLMWLDSLFPDWQLLRWEYLENDFETVATYPSVNQQRPLCAWSPELEAYRIFAALGVCAVVLRLLEYITFSRSTGVLIVCIKHMLAQDLVNWLKPTMVVTFGFGFGFALLAPSYSIEGTVPVKLLPSVDLDFGIGGPLGSVFWALYGYYEPSMLGYKNVSASVLAPLWLWIYLLIAVILLINLLIAMFSNTYTEVMESADSHYRLARVISVKTYEIKNALPPPLNLIELPARWIYRCHKASVARQQRSSAARDDDSDDDADDAPRQNSKSSAGWRLWSPSTDGIRSTRQQINERLQAVVKSLEDIHKLDDVLVEDLRGMMETMHRQRHRRRSDLYYTEAHARTVEAQARAQMLKSRQQEDAQAGEHKRTLDSVNQRLANLQAETYESFVKLDANVSRPLLERLGQVGTTSGVASGVPAGGARADAGGGAARGGGAEAGHTDRIVTEAIAHFGQAVNNALSPIAAKVDAFDSQLKDVQKKLGMLKPAPGTDGGGGAGGGVTRAPSGYLQSAHALANHAYHPPAGGVSPAADTPPAHRTAPRMLPAISDCSPMSLSISETVANLSLPPPPSSTDAGPPPEPYPPDLVASFRRFDSDGSNGIDVAELRAALNALGLRADTAQAASLHFKYDRDRSGALQLSEFAAMVADLRAFQQRGEGLAGQAAGTEVPPAPFTQLPASSAAADDEVRRVFVAFDRTGGGTIEVGDLSAALVALNLRPSAQQLNNALLGFGVDPGDASGGRLEVHQWRALVAELARQPHI